MVVPIGENTVAVSTTVSPVTHIAETIVNNEDRKLNSFPSFNENGIINKNVPTIIANKKPNINFLEGESFFKYSLIISTSIFSLS